MDAIQTGTEPGNVTADMTTKLQAAGITVTASSNTISIAADTTVTISGDITFELNGQTYTLSTGGYDTGYPELK